MIILSGFCSTDFIFGTKDSVEVDFSFFLLLLLFNVLVKCSLKFSCQKDFIFETKYYVQVNFLFSLCKSKSENDFTKVMCDRQVESHYRIN
jgi:hypothetical protein